MKGKLKKIIEKAIKAEEESIELYSAALNKAKRESTKDMLNRLFAEEVKHKEILKKMSFDQLSNLAIPKSLEQFNLAEDLQMAPLNELAELEQMFSFAIKKEEEAFNMYYRFAHALSPSKEKDLLKALAEQEKNHKILLKTEYEKIF